MLAEGRSYPLIPIFMTNTRTPSRPSAAKLRKVLKEICKAEPRTLRSAVAEEALHYDDPFQFFHDLQNYGCACGMVGSLIYHVDTRDFYDEHYAEIEGLREDWEAAMGEQIKINGDLKNFFAWFAFEETAYRMAMDDLGLDG